MDWNAAIEKNREALKRILAALVAMAGLAGGSTLPRYLHTAVLRLLRSAESSVRRLIIVAARSIVMAPPSPSRWRKAKSAPTILRSGVGTGILMPVGVPGPPPLTRPLALPLFDRLPRWETRPRRPVATSVPRISVPGITTRFPIVPRRLPAHNDPVDATRLGLRFAALASALDDLPRQAKRFARWRARRDAIRAEERNRDADAPRLPYRPHRNWPLRPGRPPGWRRKPEHEVHEVLNVVHGLAFWALERPDTS
jgi:hypothetical protein